MLLPLLLFAVISLPQGNRKVSNQSSVPVRPAQNSNLKISAPASEKAQLPGIRTDLKQGAEQIEKFFGRRFLKPVMVEVFADRATFDECLKRRMDIPQPQRWMVAAGVADRLVLLSPRVWATDAIEHDPRDSRHVREILTHELVHVYHGQHNPRPNFENMDELGWFVEGLAAYVAGQLDGVHKDDARHAFAEGVLPNKLANAWSGKYRYGICGSMVQFILNFAQISAILP